MNFESGVHVSKAKAASARWDVHRSTICPIGSVYRLSPITGAIAEQRSPASRAGRVRREPLVDAPHVKGMAALGEHADRLAVGEITQTYRAVGGRDVGSRAVHCHREAAERPLLQPGLLGSLDRQPTPAPKRAPHDGVQPEREY